VRPQKCTGAADSALVTESTPWRGHQQAGSVHYLVILLSREPLRLRDNLCGNLTLDLGLLQLCRLFLNQHRLQLMTWHKAYHTLPSVPCHEHLPATIPGLQKTCSTPFCTTIKHDDPPDRGSLNGDHLLRARDEVTHTCLRSKAFAAQDTPITKRPWTVFQSSILPLSARRQIMQLKAEVATAMEVYPISLSLSIQ